MTDGPLPGPAPAPRHRLGPAYVVLGIALAATALVTFRLQRDADVAERAAFVRATDGVAAAIQDRVRTYLDLLQGLAGFLEASSSVRLEEWQTYLQLLDPTNRYPGIVHIGCAPWVPHERLTAHVAQVRRLGLTNYTFVPKRPRSAYCPVVFLGPSGTNLSTLRGLDLAGIPDLAGLMDQAGESGRAIASGRLTWFDPPHPQAREGVLVFVPLYGPGPRPATAAERRARLSGFILGAVWPERVAQSFASTPFTAAAPFDIEIFDGLPTVPERRLYRLGTTLTPPLESDGRLERTASFSLLERTWHLRFATLPAWTAARSSAPRHSLALGLVSSVLLFGIAWSQDRGRSRAERLSRELAASERRLSQTNQHLAEQVEESLRAAQALRAANEHARNLIDSSRELIVSVDGARRITEFNAAAERAFGRSRAALLGQPVEVLFAEPGQAERIERSVLDRGWFHGEALLRRADGTTFVARADVVPVRDGHGQVVGLLGLAADVSDLKQAERAVAQRERYLSALVRAQSHLLRTTVEAEFFGPVLEALGDGAQASRAYVFTSFRHGEGQLHLRQLAEWCQPGVESQLSLPDLQALPCTEFDPDTVADLSAGRPLSGRVADLRPADRVLLSRYGVLSVLLLPIQVRGEFWGFIGFDNVAEARPWALAEVEMLAVAASALALALERSLTRAELRDSEERFRTVFELGSDGLLVLDPASPRGAAVTEANLAAAAMFGYPREAMIGLTLEALLDPASRPGLPERLQRLLQGGKLGGEMHGRRQDGSSFPLEVSAQVIQFHARRYFQVVTRDLSERKRLEAEALKTSKLESVGLLAGGIAHDFNNFLTSILGHLSLLKLGTPVGSEAHTQIEDAERAALHARGLTQQLLTFAKGGAPIKRTVRLSDLVRDTAGFVLHGSNVIAEFALPDDLWAVECDAGQIHQVIHNLTLNARQAMPEGGRVTFRAGNRNLAAGTVPPLPAGRFVELEVRDTGVGMRPEHLARLFEPYFTTKQSGGGLGLATVYAILRKHDGHITVESALGRGTTFRLYLPASTHAAPVAAAPRPVPLAGRGRVLLMDDEKPIRSVVTAMLRRLGYTVTAAADGAEALEVFCAAAKRGEPFDAVIMDLTVPGGMGGKECIRRLREIDPVTPAIVSSGYATDPVMAEYAQHGFHGVVAKPYQIHELATVLQAVIQPPPPAPVEAATQLRLWS